MEKGSFRANITVIYGENIGCFHIQPMSNAEFLKLAELSMHKLFSTPEIKPNIDPEIIRHPLQFSIGFLPRKS